MSFEEQLARLEATDDLEEMAALQEALFERAFEILADEDASLDALIELAPRFEPAGLFVGSDWERPERLQPGLVELTLQSQEGVGVECASQLRFLAIAEERQLHDKVEPEEARRFLERVLALNLRSLFAVTPEEMHTDAALARPVQRLFEVILDRLGVGGVMASLVIEAERVLLTRPIQVWRVRRMIESASEGIGAWGLSEVGREAILLHDAIYGPTSLSREHEDLDDYLAALALMDDPGLLLEADTMSTSMRRTGLVCRDHAVLVRFAAERARGGSDRLLARALGLEDMGRVVLSEHSEVVLALIDEAVHPATAQCIYGLAQLLEQGTLFQAAVTAGLRTLLTLRVRPDVAEALVDASQSAPPPSARALLLAGVLSVLGTPRGVDQGHNPTCQSARAISLWAQVDPGYLITLLVRAARDGEIDMDFEGARLVSTEIARGVADDYHPELDAVSLVLTPHLDRLYWAMSQRANDRDQDEHKWVNPAMHGWWVHRGFAQLLHEYTGKIHDAEAFVRRFYAAYHPAFNGGRELMVPQPCGVAMTNLAGTFLDWHAISIQRVDEDPAGELRVYFFNPNHDKGQDWGLGVVTSTSDHGELMGESSIPFWQFAARIYVYHYDPHAVGPLEEVPPAEVERVLEHVRASWGRDFEWES